MKINFTIVRTLSYFDLLILVKVVGETVSLGH